MGKEFSLSMVKAILAFIAAKDHFFVSEAHLQTEFIIAAAKLFPDNKYYPEIVPGNIPKRFENKYKDKGVHFDLVIKTATKTVLIEFKYITNTYSNVIDGMPLKVNSHKSLNKRRYDCWKDIERIEIFSLEQDSDVDYGYFILITNIPGLWENAGKKEYDAGAFYVEEGPQEAKIRKWKQGVSDGTTQGRDYPIEIVNSYYFKYEDFYDFGDKYGKFKSLVVEIDNK